MPSSRIGYTLCLLLATAAAAWLWRRRAATSNVADHHRIVIAIAGVVAATIAAKLPFLFFPSAVGADPTLLTWLADGKTVLWGLAGGYLGVEIAKAVLGVRARTGDAFVVPVAVAVGIGRWGCFFNGCCHGRVTDWPWGIRFVSAVDGGTLPRHPTQLYESAFHLGFAGLAAWAIGRGIMRQCWMLIYLVAYAVFRVAIETIRVEPAWLGGWTFYQVSGVVFGFIFFGLLIKRRSD